MMRVLVLLMLPFLFANECFASVAAVSTQSETDPKKFVKHFVDKTLEIVYKPKILDEQITAESIPLMDLYVDIGAIAKFSIGPRYRELSSTQKASFLKCFRNMLASRFSLTLKSALDKYKSVNVKFVINDVKTVKVGRNYIVNSTIFVNNDVINISWSVFIVNNTLKILNMSIDGVDLGKILRDEVSGNIKQLGYKGFLEDFEKRYRN